MRDRYNSGREFLRATVAASAAVALAAIAKDRGLALAQEASAPALERRRFGRTDMDVAVLGFGGAEIGYERTASGSSRQRCARSGNRSRSRSNRNEP